MALVISTSDLAIYNAALAKLGISGISSFDDTTQKARVGKAMYADTKEAALALYPWRHSRREIELTRSSETPPGSWTGLYDMDDDILNIRFVTADGRKTDFDVYERTVAVMVGPTSTETVRAEATVLTDPDAWPGYFRNAFVLYLASEVAMPLTQDERSADRLLKLAMGGFSSAKSIESQGRSQTRIDTGLFIRNRRGGRR